MRYLIKVQNLLFISSHSARLILPHTNHEKTLNLPKKVCPASGSSCLSEPHLFLLLNLLLTHIHIVGVDLLAGQVALLVEDLHDGVDVVTERVTLRVMIDFT